MTADPDPVELDDAARTTRALFREHYESAERFGYTPRTDEAMPVQVLAPSAYVPPPHARKIMSADVLALLEGALARVREINESMVGMTATVASVLLAGDERTLEVRMTLRQWAEAYAAERLAKLSPRDGGDPVRRFGRLIGELRMWLQDLAQAPGAVHFTFMAEVLEYLPWLLFQATFARWYEEDATSDALTRPYGFLAPSVEHEAYCEKMARFFAWGNARDCERVVRAVLDRRGAPQGAPPEILREQLAGLASDIREVRPFLVAGHNPEKCFAEVVPGLYATWVWNGTQGLGVIPIHRDARQRVKDVRARTSATVVDVGYDVSVRWSRTG